MSRLKEWRALDHCDDNNSNDAIVNQEANQESITKQQSEEWIIIKDSEDINVITTDIQAAAASLQIGIEAAIALVLSISIADSNQSENVMQDFNQITRTRQSNRQKTIVEKSKNIDITTIDTDIAINLQLLVQVLLAIVATLDIL